ncbi:MAG: AAA family ATPase [Lachnospiraceae bacterium]|nr:AAA family ATPase [Lachnospiraceae bacterium]
MSYTPLPIGIDDFKKIRAKEYYYVDKTWLIKELLDKKGEVNLFTRPRRFGKTLNLSMLKYFFELPADGNDNKCLFEGLKIMSAGEKYTRELGRYPVISLTLKSAKQPDFGMAYASLVDDIAREYSRHESILLSEKISEADKEKFVRIRDRKGDRIEYAKSLLFLSQCLMTCYQSKVVILIDEYDVPLENAYYMGFYDQMSAFIRSLFESALKSNLFLEFAVITGCLRISKESIFTGLNNLKINSILNEEYEEYFGFVEDEVMKMLAFYQRLDKMDTVRKWYDGYLFGNTEVYNPWSVINYTEKLYLNENAFPVAAWSNTSSNSIVKDLIYHADESVKSELEILIGGKTIEKMVHEDITYEEIHDSEDNLWNFLLYTGYLKVIGIRLEGISRYVQLAIPNNEVLSIYENTIRNWFRDEIQLQDLSVLYAAMLTGKSEVFQQELNGQLQKCISYMDNQEAFYHGFLLGVLTNLKGYLVKSNREAGDGRYDICVRNQDETVSPVILELKVSRTFKEMETEAEKALAQIEEKKYDSWLPEEGYTESIRYGIAFFKKKCRVHMVRKALTEQ